MARARQAGALRRRSASGRGARSVASTARRAEQAAGGASAPRRHWWAALEPSAGLLPLRAFLGVTFVFAGLQKLADPNFLRASSPDSIQNQLHGALQVAAVPSLVHLALHAPVAFGVGIALAELAVGIGTVFGLWARVAALGGMALSLTFFLTISFSTWPYYYGSDIVFLFAWTPFVLLGAGAWSLDAYAASRAGTLDGAPSRPGTGAPAGAVLSRRVVLSKSAMVLVLGAVGAVTAALTAVIGRAGASARPSASGAPPGGGATTTSAAGGSGTGSSGGTGSSTPPGTSIGPASAVPVGGALQFTDPSTQQPAYALQLTAGHFSARSAVCTHAGCTVRFSEGDHTFVCPCHGSVFDAANGRVLNGPAVTPLPGIAVAEGSDGNLYVT